MKKYLILIYEAGCNPFPIAEKTIRTKKTRKQIFQELKKQGYNNFTINEIY
jgi:hypothetical protein